MADVLSIEVPTFIDGGSVYPSVNMMWAQGVRYGKKTPEYHDLFVAVREAAWEAIKSTGWETAEERVEVHLRRYVPDYRQRDSSNLGKVELDAMRRWKNGEPCVGFPGVYVDDNLVRPFPDVVVDPREGAVDRIAIAVFRVVLFGAAAPAKRKAPRPAPIAAAATEVSKFRKSETAAEQLGDGRLPTLNGKTIRMEDALALIHKEKR